MKLDFNTLLDAFGLICVIGLFLYFPLKPHWSRIISIWNIILCYCGIGAPALYVYLYFYARSKGESGSDVLIGGILIGGGFLIAGIVSFVGCLTRCSSIVEAIFLPIILILMFGAFILSIFLLIMYYVGLIHSEKILWVYVDDD